MDRRAAGLVLLAVSAVLIVVVSSAARAPVRGTAVPEPVPGPPAVGDCVLVAPRDASGGTQTSSALGVAPCAGLRFGEIVRVVDDGPAIRRPDLEADAGANAEGASAPPSGPACDLGSDDLAAVRPGLDPAGWWRAALPSGFIPIVPDRRQVVAGQTWQACAIVPPTGPDGSTAPYSGPLAASMGTLEQPRAFALCGAERDPILRGSALCTEPHRVEVLAVFAPTAPTSGLSQPALDASCRQVVVTLTGMPDITAGGRLAAAAQMYRVDQVSGTLVPDPDPVDSAAGLAGWCTVTALDGLLTRSLIGLRDRPVPLR